MKLLIRSCWIFCLTFLIANTLDARTWTKNDGKSLEADYVRYKDGFVYIRGTNGKIYKVKFKDLIKADQDYTREAFKKAKANRPKTPIANPNTGSKPSPNTKIDKNPGTSPKPPVATGTAVNPKVTTIAKAQVKIAWLSGKGAVKLYDSNSGSIKTIATVDVPKGKTPSFSANAPSVRQVLFSYGGERLYATSPGNEIYSIDIATGKTNRVGTGWCTAVTWDEAKKEDILWVLTPKKEGMNSGELIRLPVGQSGPQRPEIVWSKMALAGDTTVSADGRLAAALITHKEGTINAGQGKLALLDLKTQNYHTYAPEKTIFGLSPDNSYRFFEFNKSTLSIHTYPLAAKGSLAVPDDTSRVYFAVNNPGIIVLERKSGYSISALSSDFNSWVKGENCKVFTSGSPSERINIWVKASGPVKPGSPNPITRDIR